MKTTHVIRRKELAAAISMLLAFPAMAIAQGQAADQQERSKENTGKPGGSHGRSQPRGQSESALPARRDPDSLGVRGAAFLSCRAYP